MQERYGAGDGNGNGAPKPGTSFSELFKEVWFSTFFFFLDPPTILPTQRLHSCGCDCERGCSTTAFLAASQKHFICSLTTGKVEEEQNPRKDNQLTTLHTFTHVYMHRLADPIRTSHVFFQSLSVIFSWGVWPFCTFPIARECFCATRSCLWHTH